MNTRDIQIILKIAQYRSITRTAEDFHMTQPAISNTLKRCEDELGFSLFTRQGKWLVLNEQGKIFCSASEGLLDNLAGVQSGLKLSIDHRREIHIRQFAQSDKLFRLLGEFTERNPDIRMVISSGRPEGNSFNSADFTLGMDKAVKHHEQSFLPIESRGTLYAMIAKSNPLSSAYSLRLEELAEENFVFLRAKVADGLEETWNVCMEGGLNPHVAMITETNTAKYSAIRRGIGLGLIFEHELSLAPQIHGCRLVPVMIPLSMDWLYLFWNPHQLTEPGQTLVSFLKERL